MAIVHVKTTEEFETEVKNSDKPVIVDFWAPWCGPCKMLGPVFENLAGENDNVKFVKIDIDEAEDIAQEHNIMAVPTLMVFKDGDKVATKSGAMGKSQLIEFLETNTNSEEDNTGSES